jgi:hypothetical protein
VTGRVTNELGYHQTICPLAAVVVVVHDAVDSRTVRAMLQAGRRMLPVGDLTTAELFVLVAQSTVVVAAILAEAL